jgi:hypothetical protein
MGHVRLAHGLEESYQLLHASFNVFHKQCETGILEKPLFKGRWLLIPPVLSDLCNTTPNRTPFTAVFALPLIDSPLHIDSSLLRE